MSKGLMRINRKSRLGPSNRAAKQMLLVARAFKVKVR